MSSRANPRGPAEPCPELIRTARIEADGQKPTWETRDGRWRARPLNCENDEFDRTVRLTLQFNQIVSVMPFALVFVISAVDPAFLHPFFSSAQGVVLLLLAIAMLGGGVLLVRRMLAVEI